MLAGVRMATALTEGDEVSVALAWPHLRGDPRCSGVNRCYQTSQ